MTEIKGYADVDEYYSSNNTDKAYTTCWGEGNIHFGFFPHLVSSENPVLSFEKAAEELTKQMIQLGDIGRKSKVLDLGCGYGKPACDIAVSHPDAEVWGVDLNEMHIKKAKALARSRKLTNCNFIVGSFTDLPEEINKQNGSFTHVWSQVAWCHAHDSLPAILKQAHGALQKGGKLCVNDFLGTDDKVNERTKENVWSRLKLKSLLGHDKWKKAVEKAGFEIEIYREWDKHMQHGYLELAKAAEKYNCKCSDGNPLSAKYAESALAADNNQIGMNFCIAHKV
ncbi:hypothetical protein AAMO2058_000893600 [Amorphochlora amoebiformis]